MNSLNKNFNGEASTFYSPSSGIRQGDPLSPPISLFSAWNIYLEEAINAKKWNPIKVSRSGPLLSHLMFAYDLFLFARADSKIRIVWLFLTHFKTSVSFLVNGQKSKILFSKNTHPDLMNSISDYLLISHTNNLGKYKGFPLCHGKLNRADLKYLIDKIRSRQAGKHVSLPSQEGQDSFNPYSLPSLLTWRQDIALPVSFCKALDQHSKRFLWPEKNKLYLINWDTVTLPKTKGGWVLPNLSFASTPSAPPLKLRFLSQPQSLWAQVLAHKYLPKTLILRKIPHYKTSKPSLVWKSLLKGWQLCSQGLKWTVETGNKINLWFDTCFDIGPLRHILHVPLQKEEDQYLQSCNPACFLAIPSGA